MIPVMIIPLLNLNSTSFAILYAVHTVETLLHNFLVTRPGTEFCSWIRVGMPRCIPTRRGIPEE